MRYSACSTVFAGIRNDSTSYQGLLRLHRTVGQLYTVDTGSRVQIFHPKLYLVRASGRARLLIGSANLTLAGLNNNIEAGVLLNFDFVNAADKKQIDNIEALFAALPSEYPKHVRRICEVGDLEKFLAERRLIDERVSSNNGRRSDGGENETNDTDTAENESHDEVDGGDDIVPRIKLKVKTLRTGGTKQSHPSIDSIRLKPIAPMAANDGVAEPQPTAAMTIAVEPPPASTTATTFVSKPVPAQTPTVVSFRKKSRRRREGPRLRARRVKAEAIAAGKKWYFTGEPCIYGHIADRLVSNGKCRECNRLDCERYNRWNR